MQMCKASVQKAYLPTEKVRKVFVLCWVAYFAANLARMSYSASMAGMVMSEGISGSTAGLIGTGFFFCYGGGQMVSGYFGDAIPPGHMILWGLLGTGCANLGMGLLRSPKAMLALWCLNGLMQAMLWTPILRIVAEYFPPQYRNRSCVYLSATHPIGSLVSYGASAALLIVWGWRAVYFATAAAVLIVAVIWRLGFWGQDSHRTAVCEDGIQQDQPSGEEGTGRFPVFALVFIGLALLMQGALRDGLTTWIPTFLSGSFGVSTSFATLSAIILPLVNLAGVFVANRLQRHCKNETLTAGILFLVATGAAAVLYRGAAGSYVLTLLCFSGITAGMMGINVMLVSMVPTYFVRWNKVSLIAGLLNAMVYVGSCIATYGMGAGFDTAGWTAVLACLGGEAVAGTVFSFVGAPKWKQFVRDSAHV